MLVIAPSQWIFWAIKLKLIWHDCSAVSYRRSTHPPPSILSSVKTPLTRFQEAKIRLILSSKRRKTPFPKIKFHHKKLNFLVVIHREIVQCIAECDRVSEWLIEVGISDTHRNPVWPTAVIPRPTITQWENTRWITLQDSLVWSCWRRISPRPTVTHGAFKGKPCSSTMCASVHLALRCEILCNRAIVCNIPKYAIMQLSTIFSIVQLFAIYSKVQLSTICAIVCNNTRLCNCSQYTPLCNCSQYVQLSAIILVCAIVRNILQGAIVHNMCNCLQ